MTGLGERSTSNSSNENIARDPLAAIPFTKNKEFSVSPFLLFDLGANAA
jgi:hypothetical protein